jgi:hypothetical protein
MAPAFDPYHKWLGIPPAEQPPNHYRLLAINLFESDPDVIEGAADRLMVHLRSLQTGQHADLTQKLLNKISAAKLCLLRADKKKEYDDLLRAKLAKTAPPSATPMAPAEAPDSPIAASAAAPVAAGPLDFITAPAPVSKPGVWEPEPLPVSSRGASYKTTTSGYSSRKTKKSQTPAIFGVVAVVAVLAIAIIVYATSQSGNAPDQDNSANIASRIEKHPSGDLPTTKPKPHTAPPTPSNIPGDGNSLRPPNSGVSPIVEPTHPSTDPNPIPDKPVQPKPPDNPPPTADKPPPAPIDTRKPVPDQPAKDKALAHLRDVLKDDYTKAISPEARADLVRKLIKLAAETSDDANLRYVMGMQATELAIKGGEADLAFEAIDGMNAYFTVDGWDLKAKSLIQLSHQAKTPQLRKEIAMQALTLTDNALAADHYDAAVEMAAVASTMSESVGEPLLRDQAHEARARTQRMQNIAQEYKAAKEKLAAHPDDAEANLAVGRFLCFQKDDWKAGVAYLARGNDESLKALARLESAAPTTPPDQAKLADAWWAAAEKIGDKNNPVVKPMFARAKYWYHEAIPGLTGLALVSAQNRSSDAAVESGGGKMVYLDDLPEQELSVADNEFGKHGETGYTDVDQKEIRLRSTPAKHALSFHPPDGGTSKVSYLVDKKFRSFVAIVGLNDGSKPASPVTFEVRGDGRLLWLSHPIHGPGESQECNVTVSNAKVLQLLVHCTGKSDGCRTVWINPVLKK